VGPSNIPNVSGARWFITFIDDCTRVTWVFLLKQKSYVSFVQYFFLNGKKINLALRGLDLIMLKIILIMNLTTFVVRRVSFMNHLVSKNFNKMGLLKEKK